VVSHHIPLIRVGPPSLKGAGSLAQFTLRFFLAEKPGFAPGYPLTEVPVFETGEPTHAQLFHRRETRFLLRLLKM